MEVITDPYFLALTMKAQAAYGKSSHIGDSKALEGRFAVLDMLDVLGEHFKANQGPRNQADD